MKKNLNDNVDEELEQVNQTLRNVGHTHAFRNTRPGVRPDPEGNDQPEPEVNEPAGPEQVLLQIPIKKEERDEDEEVCRTSFTEDV